MKNPFGVSIESVDNSKTTQVGFLLFAARIALPFFTEFRITIVALIVMCIPVAIWVFTIAVGLNRSIFLWTIFALISPSFCLIFIGSLKAKASKNKALQKIIDKCRADYAAEKHFLIKDKYLGSELKKQLKDLKHKHTEILQSEVRDFYYPEMKKRDMEEVEVEEVVEKDTVSGEVRKRKTVKIDGVVYSADKCPACGYHITEDMDVCPDCGIALK